MDFDTIFQKIIALAGEQFQADKQVLGAETTAADIPTWNSLSHVMFIAAIEKEFGIKFDLLEMIEMKSIGDIARATHTAVK